MRRLAHPLRGALVGLAALGLVVGAAGCSSSGSDSSSTTTTTLAPEEIFVTAAEVTAGLATLGELVATATTQAATDVDTAKATVDRAWEQWLAIEGTIKKNDTAAYLEFEDALSDMRIGADEDDAAKVERGATAVTRLSAAYLAKFPG